MRLYVGSIKFHLHDFSSGSSLTLCWRQRTDHYVAKGIVFLRSLGLVSSAVIAVVQRCSGPRKPDHNCCIPWRTRDCRLLEVLCKQDKVEF